MKIGIITFHWATNYGAILQAFALHTYLQNLGHDVKIINYVPFTGKKTLLKCFKTKHPKKIPQKLLDYRKELRLEKFRQKHLPLTKEYTSNDELHQNPPQFDVYICGSDQIWNPYFTAEGERKPTLSYFLDFGADDVIRLSYAVSFGCTKYPRNLYELVVPFLKRFTGISVREKSGKQIMNNFGIDKISLLPDPTLLLKADGYKKLLCPDSAKKGEHAFIYSLHANQKTMEKLKTYINQQKSNNIIDTTTLKHGSLTLECWLTSIKTAHFVITNSFHGVVFAIIFKKHFIAVPVEGKHTAMNDRIATLLKDLELEEHIMKNFDFKCVDLLLAKDIDWKKVGQNVKRLRCNADLFFKKYLPSEIYPNKTTAIHLPL